MPLISEREIGCNPSKPIYLIAIDLMLLCIYKRDICRCSGKRGNTENLWEKDRQILSTERYFTIHVFIYRMIKDVSFKNL